MPLQLHPLEPDEELAPLDDALDPDDELLELEDDELFELEDDELLELEDDELLEEAPSVEDDDEPLELEEGPELVALLELEVAVLVLVAEELLEWWSPLLVDSPEEVEPLVCPELAVAVLIVPPEVEAAEWVPLECVPLDAALEVVAELPPVDVAELAAAVMLPVGVPGGWQPLAVQTRSAGQSLGCVQGSPVSFGLHPSAKTVAASAPVRRVEIDIRNSLQ